MADPKKALITLYGVVAAYIILKRRRRRRNRTQWIRQWIQERERQGAYENLLQELRLSDIPGYTNFVRMDPATFDLLLNMVTPLITRQDTHLRLAIPAAERLALTLRFLATGISDHVHV